jgi:hypothetical protein
MLQHSLYLECLLDLVELGLLYCCKYFLLMLQCSLLHGQHPLNRGQPLMKCFKLTVVMAACLFLLSPVLVYPVHLTAACLLELGSGGLTYSRETRFV